MNSIHSSDPTALRPGFGLTRATPTSWARQPATPSILNLSPSPHIGQMPIFSATSLGLRGRLLESVLKHLGRCGPNAWFLRVGPIRIRQRVRRSAPALQSGTISPADSLQARTRGNLTDLSRHRGRRLPAWLQRTDRAGLTEPRSRGTFLLSSPDLSAARRHCAS
jgi:hypothetical protein